MPVYPVAAVRNKNFGGPTFLGAYDAIPSIAAAYSSRRLRTAYTGSILRLRRSSDNTESNIGYTADGHLDTAAVASFIGAGSGYIVTWYDQSGNGYNASQTAEASRQPLYVASGQNGRPVGRFDGVDDWLGCELAIDTVGYGAMGVVDSAVTKSWVGLSASGSQFMAAYHISTGANRHNHKNGASEVGGGIFDVAATNGVHVRYIDHAGTTYGQSVDGSYTTTTATVASFVSTWLTLGAYRSGVATAVLPLAGDIAELIICNAALSTGNRQAAEAAANAYWAVYA